MNIHITKKTDLSNVSLANSSFLCELHRNPETYNMMVYGQIDLKEVMSHYSKQFLP